MLRLSVLTTDRKQEVDLTSWVCRPEEGEEVQSISVSIRSPQRAAALTRYRPQSHRTISVPQTHHFILPTWTHTGRGVSSDDGCRQRAGVSQNKQEKVSGTVESSRLRWLKADQGISKQQKNDLRLKSIWIIKILSARDCNMSDEAQG